MQTVIMSETDRFRAATLAYKSGQTVKQAATSVGLKYGRLRKFLAEAGILRPQSETFQRSGDPTPEELIQRRDAIKNAWTAEEREKRRVGRGRYIVNANVFEGAAA